MKLSELIKACSLLSSASLKLDNTHDPDISSICSNSKTVRPDSLFIAIRGLVADGHDYMEKAFGNGAAAVIAEKNPKNLGSVILVKNTRLCMAAIAARFYGNPSKELILVGITGTNGKTTTSWLLESIFKACGFNTGVIGTVNIRYNDQTYDNPVTTPDSIDLQQTLHDMKKAGVTHVIMEVSSHGLDLNRVDFCQFNAGVFTNLTQDHLDYHKTLDEYFNCKKRFFTHLLGSAGKAPAILNIDDAKGEELSKTLPYKTVCVSTRKKTDVFAQDIIDDITGLSGTICLPDGSFSFLSSITGRFNLENILCAVAAATALNLDKELIKRGIENCKTIPGRLEKIDNEIDRHLFVDYAHTPDALESILMTLKQRAPKRLITLFGCGGDRDREKRPIMGQIACNYSDIAIATSDNPRSEDPDSIIEDIQKGITAFQKLSDHDLKVTPFKKGYLIEPDRKKAIEKAISISKSGDIIVAAGKGHETYQITNKGTIHFDDREELKKAARQFDLGFKPVSWKISDLEAALKDGPVFSTLEQDHTFTGISTDSRTITKTQVFIALKGENFDGHIFVNRLMDRGIKGFITEKGFFDRLDNRAKNELEQKSIVLFEAPSTLTALGMLARFQRIRSNVKVLAITGSSGKTTTRKITQEIFKTHFHTHATHGNFNNEIGVPLTLLNLCPAHEWAIVEMGMNHPGEISRLSRIAVPDIAMVINTAGVHLEGLGSVDNVAKAKAEIFEGVRENGTAILFSDDPRREILEARAKENKNIKNILFFGPGNDSDMKAVHIEKKGNSTQFRVLLNTKETDFSINSPALFMVDNSLAAIIAARVAGIDSQGILKGLNAFTPVSGRMNIYKLSDSITLMDDTYNANPASVTQALNTLSEMGREKTCIAVLGDMLELGEQSEKLHREIGQKAALLGISRLYIFGTQVKYLMEGAIENGFPKEFIFHGTKDQIVNKVLENIDTETIILVKGSRGMAMETVIQKFQQILTVDS